MCYGCWIKLDRPFALTPAVVEAAPLFAKVMHERPLGEMHAVVEDWNLDADSVLGWNSEDMTPDEKVLSAALQRMSFDERWATALCADLIAQSRYGEIGAIGGGTNPLKQRADHVHNRTS